MALYRDFESKVKINGTNESRYQLEKGESSQRLKSGFDSNKADIDHAYSKQDFMIDTDQEFEFESKDKKFKNQKRKFFGHELLALENHKSMNGIITFNEQLDELLGGGIYPGTMTEVCGTKGVGKSTFCFQLCLNVQLPKRFMSGLDAESIYIDTESTLSASRMREMIKCFVEHCNGILYGQESEFTADILTEEQIMSKIHIYRNCHDIDDLVRVVLSLESFLEKNSRVKLLVIDSIAFLMYTVDSGFSSQTKVLYGVGQVLLRLVNKFGLALVIINNMTTLFSDDESDLDSKSLTPFLGDSWKHVSNQRLIFSWAPGNEARQVTLVSSNFRRLGSTNFRIISEGFRK